MVLVRRIDERRGRRDQVVEVLVFVHPHRSADLQAGIQFQCTSAVDAEFVGIYVPASGVEEDGSPGIGRVQAVVSTDAEVEVCDGPLADQIVKGVFSLYVKEGGAVKEAGPPFRVGYPAGDVLEYFVEALGARFVKISCAADGAGPVGGGLRQGMPHGQ